MWRRGEVGKDKEIPTIWEIPDELWVKVEKVLTELSPPKPTGRKRVNPRSILNGIIFRARSGCQWNKLPREYGDDSTIHRTFQKWVRLGVFVELWSVMVRECDELGEVDWQWQAADAALGKARLGGMKSDQIPRTGGKRAPRRVSWLKEEVGL
jgi:putative transposase